MTVLYLKWAKIRGRWSGGAAKEGLIWRRGLYRHLAARAVPGSRPARMRVRFFFLFLFLPFFVAVDDRCCHMGTGLPGGVPVDGIRVAGGPPAAPAEGLFHFCTLLVGAGYQMGSHPGGSWIPNGITMKRLEGPVHL